MAMTRGQKIALIISGILLTLLVVVIGGVALLVYAFRSSEPEIKSNSVLMLRIYGDLPDYTPDDPFARLLGAEDNSLTNLLTQIKKAKVDKRISAVLLQVDMTGAGWAKSEEIRDTIADFRTSGKPIYAFMDMGLNKEYYIATACDHVYVTPPGELFIQGFAADVMFFRGSLDKLGIYPDFEQIGKYKNAPDAFTRKEMSDAHREVINAILDDYNNRFIETTAKARNKSVEEVKAIIDNAPYNSWEAQKVGLIDGVKYKDEIESELKARLGYKDSDKLNITKASDYKQVSPESVGLNKGERIAVIYGTGAINTGKSENSPTGGQSIGSDTLAKAIKDAADDKNIKAIVLRVDSPGGSAVASDLIWRATELAREKKPVVVSMGDVAASGGYYIACNANKIIAEPSTLTGSIGIFAGKPVMKGFYDWIGITNEYVLRGKNAGLFRETEKFTDEERAKFKGLLSHAYYDDFVPKVAKGRNRNPEYIDTIGQGHVWTGAQGKGNGLVDDFGGLDQAIEVAKQLAGIPADKGIERVIMPHPRTFLEQLWGNDDDEEKAKVKQQQQAMLAALPEDARRALRYAALMDQMQRGEVMALMPFDLRIK